MMRNKFLMVCGALIVATHSIYVVAVEKESQKPAPVVKEEITPLEQGKQLHAAKCVSCHSTEIYTREERKVTRYEGLQSRVETCAVNLDLSWFDDDINNVVNYLNTDYYKFSEDSQVQENQK